MGVQMEQDSIRRDENQVRGCCRVWCTEEECGGEGDGCPRSSFVLVRAVNAIADDDGNTHTGGVGSLSLRQPSIGGCGPATEIKGFTTGRSARRPLARGMMEVCDNVNCLGCGLVMLLHAPPKDQDRQTSETPPPSSNRRLQRKLRRRRSTGLARVRRGPEWGHER
jgi:hypothetical protein